MNRVNEQMQEQLPSHYVGIGASAGGLEALQEFFSHLPLNTGAAFIVVQHLSPDFKSMMPELLEKHTRMPIHQVNDGIDIEPNSIYLIPPRKYMLIVEGKLLLSDQNPESHLHMPIDVFLKSLAVDQQHRAIAIVLSGTGSDGTRGVKTIKESDGLVIVQEPSSAKFDGMPMSVYRTGLADLVLAPRDMGPSLVSFIQHPSISGQDRSIKSAMSDSGDVLTEIFGILKKQSSINFSLYKASTVARRIERRLSINQLTTLDSYLRLLLESPRELQTLSKELLIGVTRFFRDEEAFAKIANSVVPQAVEAALKRKDAVRLWIAGCSTGEEAYSMAILFEEYIKKNNLNCAIKIFATDVDEDAIAEAGAGVYPLDISQDIAPERLEKYFTFKDDSYVISPSLRQMVIFASHNMIDDPPFSNIDMISCRNVLIYFQHAAQKKVLSSLYFALHKDGFLFLGSSETLGDLQNHFETIDERSKIYSKVSNARIPIGNTPPLRDVSSLNRPAVAMSPVNRLLKPARLGGRDYLESAIDRLIREYAPDCILVNDNLDAVHVYGDVTSYTKGLGAGRVSNCIKDIVVDDLAVAVSTALVRAEKNRDDVYYKDISIQVTDEEPILVDLSVFYVKDSDAPTAPFMYVVQFIRQSYEGEQLKAPKINFDAAEQSRQRIRDLEVELVKKQEHLQVTVEELETTNEELQSANEELMSANEELQSTNEELQSVNEELYTVNTEYQEKIVELTEVNDDLDSVINATDIGIIFLDEQLAIRKFTPPATRYINLQRSDVGRPFHHISHELDYDDFLTDIANVCTKGEPIERDKNTVQGQALLVRIIPYSKSGMVEKEGVLITITNISRQKFVESALQQAQDQMRNTLLDRTEYIHRRVETRSNKMRVLLLDDDEVDRKRLKKMLQSIRDRDFDIQSFDEIDEAINSAKSSEFDICLVDYRLAEGTSRDFAQRLRDEGINTPMVVITGYSDVDFDDELLNEDIFDFLNKDEISGQLLIRSIDYVLERKRMRDVLDSLNSDA